MSFERCHPEIAEEIRVVPISNRLDFPIWTGNSHGGFSISNCYNLLREKAAKVRWYNVVWRPSVMPRHAFILWLVIKNRMKSADILNKKRITTNPKSCLCGIYDESSGHLFFECSTTSVVWSEILKSRGFRRQPKGWNHEWLFI